MSKPCRARLRDQQGARAIGGKPDAIVPGRSLVLSLQAIQQLQHFARRIARQKISGQHAGRRAQQVDLLLQCVAYAGCGKTLNRNGRTQQVAIA
jgi:hypothetical protein